MKAASLLLRNKRVFPTVVLSVAITLMAGVSAAWAQAPAQLSLADILIGLRSKKVELPERNKILTEAVLGRGITFSLTPEIEKELDATGADKGLIDAIRKKSVMVKTSAVMTPANDVKPNPVSTSPAAVVQDFSFFMKRAETSKEKGDLDAALVDFGKAIETKPDSFEAYLERGIAHLNKKAFELAVSDLNKAVELNSKSAMAWANRGDAYEKKGDAVHARADYQKAVELDVNVEPAKSNLAKIVAEEVRVQKEAEAQKAEEAKKAEDAKRLADAKKVVPQFVDLGQIYISAAVKMTTPTYPSAALRAGIAGLVKVEVSIDEQGNVTDAKAIEGHQFLRMSAEDAARRSKFKPALFDGKPIKSKGYILYNFAPTTR
jgi:TonB family C-terminal domain